MVSQTKTCVSLGNFLKTQEKQEGPMGASGDITVPFQVNIELNIQNVPTSFSERA